MKILATALLAAAFVLALASGRATASHDVVVDQTMTRIGEDFTHEFVLAWTATERAALPAVTVREVSSARSGQVVTVELGERVVCRNFFSFRSFETSDAARRCVEAVKRELVMGAKEARASSDLRGDGF
jgi:hypothetical protein